MPIGIQRINNVRSQPSSQIVFIKPLPGPDEAYSKDFLERIAAICHPIMKSNHHSIMTLEEHEANREFVGRNFNAGEIIQLVLKSYRTGQWLSFRTVQMVMMHELAHCQQMNHSRQFWQVRNQFAAELRGLWAKGYTGDGLWGRGQTLLSGRYHAGGSHETDELPTQLCGGVYRRRPRKRRKGNVDSLLGSGSDQSTIKREKDKDKESWSEKKQRRIRKKFGVNGQTLGDDREVRTVLEKGQVIGAKPRVANSWRGRELRVAAALARFGQQKEDQEVEQSKPVTSQSDRDDQAGDFDHEDVRSTGSSTESESDDASLSERNGPMLSKTDFINVCGAEDPDDVHVKQEMDEMKGLDQMNEHRSCIRSQQTAMSNDRRDLPSTGDMQLPPHTSRQLDILEPHVQQSEVAEQQPSTPQELSCPICSLHNDSNATECAACAHLLKPAMFPGCWQCEQVQCKGYVNVANAKACGACTFKRPR